ncbi:MAG: xanthine dehydrogenase family protein molybdopterin-binding subunit [Deltaproteobacteria bacterium]|nr:xanthine dehydrogenase family protein molybdopterin-binding subunit [Deltaproteobacteria bacterium]
MQEFSIVGKAVPPVRGKEKCNGKAVYPSDISLPGMLWGKILRCPHAHAEVVSVDTSEAARTPGVVAVVTHTDAPAIRLDLMMLTNRVRFVGDGVAAVAAEDWNIAEEAARKIRVRYEVLPAVFDPVSAAEPDAPKLHPGGNIVNGSPGVPSVANKRGDIEQGFREASCVVERVFRQPQANSVSHEPHAAVAYWEDGKLTVWDSSQKPFVLQNQLAETFGLPTEKVRVIASTIGGSFGGREETDRISFVAALLSQKTGRPVKIWYTREEETLQSYERPGMIHFAKIGAKRDGALTAIQVRSYFDNGYWDGATKGAGMALAWGLCTRITELYNRCPNVDWEVYIVRTNHPKSGPFRGRSDTESHFPIESLLDELAEKLELDPIELRRKNLIRTGDMLRYPAYPEQRLSGWSKPVSQVGVEECIERGKALIGWERRNPAPASTPGTIKQGIGMALSIHSSGSAPRISEARIEIDLSGNIRLFSGTTDQGAEQQTTLRQMAAEILNVPIDRIGGINADTELCPYETGPISSRTVYAAGHAVTRAAKAVRERLLEEAAKLLGVPSEDLELRDGFVESRNGEHRKISLGEVVGALGQPVQVLGRCNPGDEPVYTYAFAATFAEVEVDTATGEVRVKRIISACDIGRAINPMVVEGQIHGAVAQGLGYVFREGLSYDPRTGTLLNQWFLDLNTPSMLDFPSVEPILVEQGEPSHPFQAKGCGELPIIGVPPAIANAIYNAIGVRFDELPITPERVLEALQAKGCEP